MPDARCDDAARPRPCGADSGPSPCTWSSLPVVQPVTSNPLSRRRTFSCNVTPQPPSLLSVAAGALKENWWPRVDTRW